MYALFDKNKKFITFAKDFPDYPNIDIFKLEISEEKSDLREWRWDGDMLTGQMVKINP